MRKWRLGAPTCWTERCGPGTLSEQDQLRQRTSKTSGFGASGTQSIWVDWDGRYGFGTPCWRDGFRLTGWVRELDRARSIGCIGHWLGRLGQAASGRFGMHGFGKTMERDGFGVMNSKGWDSVRQRSGSPLRWHRIGKASWLERLG